MFFYIKKKSNIDHRKNRTSAVFLDQSNVNRLVGEK